MGLEVAGDLVELLAALVHHAAGLAAVVEIDGKLKQA